MLRTSKCLPLRAWNPATNPCKACRPMRCPRRCIAMCKRSRWRWSKRRPVSKTWRVSRRQRRFGPWPQQQSRLRHRFPQRLPRLSEKPRLNSPVLQTLCSLIMVRRCCPQNTSGKRVNSHWQAVPTLACPSGLLTQKTNALNRPQRRTAAPRTRGRPVPGRDHALAPPAATGD